MASEKYRIVVKLAIFKQTILEGIYLLRIDPDIEK